MMEAVLLVLGAVLGYGGHWAQTALDRRHKRKDADEERISELLTKLFEIRDLKGDDTGSQGRDLAERLAPEAALLRNRKLRRRVMEATSSIQTFWIIASPEDTVESVRTAWAEDAIACCQAALRGDRLPGHAVELQFHLFAFSEVLDRAMRSLSEVLTDWTAADPALVARQRAFGKWQAKQCPFWRRTPRMWVMLLRSE
ncbi:MULTISPECIES: hypothetical protein [unclassified Streptomyces]|uniref:hypothetical protein n=1 Tax=unclassified Streptomyces TaxID=2593676 RepID=UPI003825FB71